MTAAKRFFRWKPSSAATVAMLLATSWPTGARGQTKKEEKHWSAQWITAEGVAERDQVVLHFRKVVEMKDRPKEFVVDLSADNQFIFYVNGREARRGPSRGDLAHWRYQRFDIAPLLHGGSNVLAATVWHFGTHAAIAQMSERAGFLLHGAGETERAADTNATWEVEEETGISLLKPKVKGYFAADPGERWDGGRFDWDAGSESAEPAKTRAAAPAEQSSARTDDGKKWTQAVTIGRGALREEQDAPNNWQLVRDALPPMERTELPPGRVVQTSCAVSSEEFFGAGMEFRAGGKCRVLLDQGELTTGYPVLAVSEGRGATIRLTYAEALLDEQGQKGNRNQIDGKHIEGVADEFRPEGGAAKREFSPLTWRTWRYLQLDVETHDEPVKIAALRSWFSAYPFAERAYFHADDSSLDAIWKIGWRTARLDAHDTYMDTPYWERLQYIGDTRIQALISYTVAGDDRLARQAMEAFDSSRLPDGLTQSRYPSSLVQMIPTFSLMWVGMVHDFWTYRGDREFVRGQLPGTRTALGWFLRRQRADGLLGKLSWWPFVDWGADFADGAPPEDDDGGSAVMTLQLVEALRYGEQLERTFGEAAIAESYEKAAARAAEAVSKLCWNEKYGLLADTPAQKHFSQHANILGVWLDVIRPDEQKEVLGKILSNSDAGFTATGEVPAMTVATYYFRFYLARAVEHAGMGDEYLKLLGPWREMVSLGLTTWAESPEPTRSDSHAWSAHPNYDFLRIVAGIRPGSEGFTKVTIEPHPGGLKNLKAAMPIPQGVVEVEYLHFVPEIAAKVKLPEGVTGQLVWNGRRFALQPGENLLGTAGR